MKILRLNGHMMRTKTSMYNHIAAVFSLPSYFGNNLDALWDVLSDIDEPTLIEFTQIKYILKYLDGYGVKILEIFQLLETYNENISVHFYEGEMDAETEQSEF